MNLGSGSQMEVTFSKSYLRKTYQVLTNEEAQQLITRFKFLGGMEVGLVPLTPASVE